MRRVATGCFIASVLLGGCAGPTGLQLRADTEEMGPSFGYLQQNQILVNLGRMIDDPWAMPGHIEVSSGQMQVQDQGAVGWKLPYTGLLGHGVREFDVTGLQSQEQHSFSLAPVTDGDDLRRLHALYRYAICHDKAAFEKEWRDIIRPYQNALRNAAGSNPQTQLQKAQISAVEQAKRQLADDNNRLTTAKNKQQDAFVAPPGDPRKGDLPDLQKAIDAASAAVKADQDRLNSVLGGGNPLNLDTLAIKGPAAATNAQAPSSSSGQDTVEVEQQKGDLIAALLEGAGDWDRWLYWRPVIGAADSVCPGNITPELAGPDHERGQWLSLGVYGRHELWTNDPERASQFMMLAQGSIPNTAGVHNLGSSVAGNGGSVNSPAKATLSTPTRVQVF